MYYSVIYEENQKGYLLNTFYIKLQSLELCKSIFDDFVENDYIFSDKVFIIEDKFNINKTYSIISHKKNIISDNNYKVLFMNELENGFLYHIETRSEFFDLEKLPRVKDQVVQYISRTLDEELNINLN